MDEGRAAPFALATGEGEQLDWMGDPTVLKVTAEATGGRYSIAEVVSGPGSIVPLHVHHREDEAFWVLDGEIDFWVAGERIHAGPGSFVFGPRDVAHRYEVRSPSARLLMVFSPAGFEGFIRETSSPPSSTGSGPPTDDDLASMLAAAARYGAEVLEEG